MGKYFDALLPASTPFELRVRAPETGNIGGLVEIWPKADEDCRERLSSQHYQLRMTPSGEKDERVLRTEVPALQVDQEYCFRFDLRRTPTEAELDHIAIDASNALLAKLLHSEACYSASEKDAHQFEAALKDLASSQTDVKAAAEVALRAFVVLNRTTCVPLMNALVVREQVAKELNDRIRNVEAMLAVLLTTPAPGPQRSPFVLLNGSVRPAELLFTKDAVEADLSEASRQLAARPAQGSQKQVLLAWSVALSNFRLALKAAGMDKAKRERVAQGWARELKNPKSTQVPSLPFIELSTGEGFVSADEYKRKPVIGPEDVEKQLDAMAGVQGATLFKVAVHDYGAALANQALAVTAFKTANEEADKHTDTTHAALLAAFKSDATRSRLAVAFASAIAAPAGEGKTPAAANYAAVDVGVAFALPNGSEAQHAWVLPYIGLNLYGVPVDRTVSPSQLVGPRFWQRVSLTVGMTLKEPSLPDRATKSVLFDNYPLAAVGYRLTPFTRISAGGVFYWLDAANPASDDVEFHVAPFIAASLDIDVVHMLTQAKL